MSWIEWLEQKVHGFANLTNEERNLIMEFSLLWSLFEAQALESSGSAKAIVDAAQKWAGKGLLAKDTFASELAYFQNRYYANRAPTHRFGHLHLRENDRVDLVEAVLIGDKADPADVAAALLIIVYRFRNNFFHWLKWAYDFREQRDNFLHANAILVRAIDLHERA